MKTTLPILNTVILLSISSLLFAQHITKNRAIDVAKNHISIVGGNKFKSATLKKAKPELLPILSSVAKNDTLIFVVNDTINNNWVIVAADERVWPIIAYSSDSQYNAKDQPSAFIDWIENKKREIENVKINNVQSNNAISQEWQDLSISNSNSTTSTASGGPLLQTMWNQGCYYNSLCPSDVNGSCDHALTGCVATSMAQIMKYWGYPTNGTGSHSYTHTAYGNLMADFGAATYQWSQMPNSVTSENSDVATLLFHCGVSVDMNYGPENSGAGQPRDAFVNNFNYSSNAKFISKSSYSESDWVYLLKAELDLKRPIYYTGYSSEGGHSWICDDYQDSNYFHFNWGWGGYLDGYFYLGGTNYNNDQAAIINIIPTSFPEGFNGFFLSANNFYIGGNGGNATIDISSSGNWTANSNQTWLTINTSAGIRGTTTITIAAEKNNTTSERTAIVTVSAVGFDDQTIIVRQGIDFVITSGKLRDVLESELASITNLTISGTIDARDFKTMRDEMPLLAELDLSNAVITGYTGILGTAGIGETLHVYPANTLPGDSFFNNNTYQGKTSLTKIILPKSITSIGFRAFEGCRGLISISIPDLVSSIDWAAFFDCNGMTSIFIPSSVTTIGNQAFSANSGMITVASDNPNYSSNEGVLFDKNQYKLIQCPISKSGSYSIPSTVKFIEAGAFQACNNLKSITIPTSVTTIREAAFYYCMGLSSISIPSSVTTIEKQAFWYNNALISVDENNLSFSSFDGALFNKNKTKIIQCSFAKSSFIIPSTVTEIGAHSFENCTRLISVTIPTSVKSIGDYAFWSTCNLSTVDIPSSVTSIGEFAFHALGTYSKGVINVNINNPNYSSVEGILFDKYKTKLIMCPDFKTGIYTIPSTVNTIANRAFLGCYALTSVVIPAAVMNIGYEAFSRCSGLKSIYNCGISPVTLSSDWYSGSYNVFNGVNKSICILYVPAGSKSAYQAASQWKDYTNIVEMSDLRISSSSETLTAAQNSQVTVDVTSNAYWTASSDQSWLTISPSSGIGNMSITITAEANLFTIIRTATVTVSATNLSSKTISVTQEANSNSFSHFTPVWIGNGVDHMSISIYSATIDGVDLEAGDEIGIFDGSLCVGVGTLTSSLFQTNTLDVVVSHNDGSGNGYTIGNSISYKFFDKSAKQEIASLLATYSDNDPSWSIDGKFTIGVSAFVSLSATTIVHHDIAFNLGWNIFSTNVIPENPDMKVIFQSFIDAGTLKKVTDEAGKTLENFGAFGGWKNNIGNIQAGKGYKVNVLASSTLSLAGTRVQLPFDIVLNTGWNIISYPSTNPQDAKALFQSLIDVGKLKKVMDESGKTIENFGAFGGWKNNIGDFIPGKGYKVNVTSNCTLTIPASGIKSAIVVPEVIASSHFLKANKGNGTDHMNLHLINLQASGITSGDEIGIYDGTLCVGSATIGTEQLIDGSISIPVSANDEQGEVINGFIDGHSIELKLYRGSLTFKLQMKKLSGTDAFEKNGSLFAKVNANELSEVQITNDLEQIKCYPNPFNQEITIEVLNPKQNKITVEIYSINGQLMKSLYNGDYDAKLVLKWNGINDSGQKVAPGAYLCNVNGVSKQVIFEGEKRKK